MASSASIATYLNNDDDVDDILVVEDTQDQPARKKQRLTFPPGKLTDTRTNMILQQVELYARDALKHGTQGATFKIIAANLKATPEFQGLTTVSWETIKNRFDSVYLDFKVTDTAANRATGTGNEVYGEREKILTEIRKIEISMDEEAAKSIADKAAQREMLNTAEATLLAHAKTRAAGRLSPTELQDDDDTSSSAKRRRLSEGTSHAARLLSLQQEQLAARASHNEVEKEKLEVLKEQLKL